MAEKKEKKKKNDSVTVSLPKARASLKQNKEMQQMKGNYEDAWKAAGYVAIVLIIGFVLLGGVNQRKVWEWFKDLGYNIGSFFGGWVNDADVEVTDDGVYVRPGAAGDSSEDNQDTQNEDTNNTINEKENESGGQSETSGTTPDTNNE